MADWSRTLKVDILDTFSSAKSKISLSKELYKEEEEEEEEEEVKI
jgi:hypothetical protein